MQYIIFIFGITLIAALGLINNVYSPSSFSQPRTWISAYSSLEGLQLQSTLNEEDFISKDLQNSWTLAILGYTHCPDVCPMSLSILSSISKEIEDSRLRIMMVAFDHKRDNLSHLKKYTAYFGNNVFAVQGKTVDDTNFLVSSLGAAYAPSEDGKFDHSPSLFLISPKGHLIGLFPTISRKIGPEIKNLIHNNQQDLSLHDPWIAKPIAESSHSSGYFKFINKSQNDFNITEVSSDTISNIELHKTEQGKLMSMKEVDAVMVEKQQEVVFSPMGLHLMLFNIRPNLDHHTLIFKSEDQRQFITIFPISDRRRAKDN